MKSIPFDISTEMENKTEQLMFFPYPCDYISQEELEDPDLSILPISLMEGNPIQNLITCGIITEQEKQKLLFSILYDDSNNVRRFGAIPTAILSEDLSEYSGKVKFIEKIPQRPELSEIALTVPKSLIEKMGNGISKSNESNVQPKLVNVKTRVENGDWLVWKTWQVVPNIENN